MAMPDQSSGAVLFLYHYVSLDPQLVKQGACIIDASNGASSMRRDTAWRRYFRIVFIAEIAASRWKMGWNGFGEKGGPKLWSAVAASRLPISSLIKAIVGSIEIHGWFIPTAAIRPTALCNGSILINSTFTPSVLKCLSFTNEHAGLFFDSLTSRSKLVTIDSFCQMPLRLRQNNIHTYSVLEALVSF